MLDCLGNLCVLVLKVPVVVVGNYLHMQHGTLCSDALLWGVLQKACGAVLYAWVPGAERPVFIETEPQAGILIALGYYLAPPALNYTATKLRLAGMAAVGLRGR